jgi:N-acetylneuraminic acid mutarotase
MKYFLLILIFVSLFLVFASCRKAEVIRNYSRPLLPGAASQLCNPRPVVHATLVPIGRLSSARAYIQCVSADNKIFFVGGNDSSIDYGRAMLPVDIYDITNNTWSVYYPDRGANLSNFKYYTAVVSNANKVFIAGGSGDGMGDFLTGRVDIYDVLANTWSTAQLSEGGAKITAASVADKVVFAGGFGFTNALKQDALKTVDIYDNSSDTWSTASLSEARMNISATTIGTKIYFAGGRTRTAASKAIDIYDAASNTWSTSELSEPKFGIAGMPAGNKIYWAGGHNSVAYDDKTAQLNKVEIRDIEAGSTTFECIRPKGTYSAVAKDHTIIFYPTNSEGDNTAFEIYNTITKTWSIATLNMALDGASIISVNNTIYIAGGWGTNGLYYDQVWKLEF